MSHGRPASPSSRDTPFSASRSCREETAACSLPGKFRPPRSPSSMDLGHFSQSSIQDVANCIRPLQFHRKSQMGAACFSTQLIDGDGVFNVSKLENFMKEVRLGECRLSYAVVSIMGPQSSRKSTLLNHLFGPNVRETDAFKGRSQTTKGIWLVLAKAKNIEPCTLVMDLEGTDGRERGEQDQSLGIGLNAIVKNIKGELD